MSGVIRVEGSDGLCAVIAIEHIASVGLDETRKKVSVALVGGAFHYSQHETEEGAVSMVETFQKAMSDWWASSATTQEPSE